MYSVKMPTMDSVARFKAAMDSDKGALGPFMIGTDPAFVEAAGYAGYDFVLLDMEHGTTTFQTLPHLIRAANVAGVCPVVRVPRGSDIWIDQALDVGAGAIMIPQIDTAEQARAAVSAAKFSPVGTRGTCRFVRSAGFGAVPGSEYFSKAQDTVVILQAEGKKAVENLDEILDVPGIDVVFVGPYDLSSSLGHVGEIDHPEVVECIKGIIAKANAKGVKLGCFADTVEGGRKWRDMGVKFNIENNTSVRIGIYSTFEVLSYNYMVNSRDGKEDYTTSDIRLNIIASGDAREPLSAVGYISLGKTFSSSNVETVYRYEITSSIPGTGNYAPLS